MAVYCVYRCHYGAPSEKHVRRFEYDSVLEWAQAVFRQFPEREEADDYASELLGGLHVYSIGSIFTADDDEGERKPPKTMRDVHEWFGDMYVNEQKNGPHSIQILTDDDELEMAVYVFDGHYRKANPGKADFLLLDGWELPDGDAEGTWKPPPTARIRDLNGKPKPGEPVTYAAFLAHYDSWNLEGLGGGERVAGVRLPDLARFLLTEQAKGEVAGAWEALWDGLHKHLRARKGDDVGFRAAIRKHPDDMTSWGAYADWLQERGEPPPGIRLLRGAMQCAEVRDGSIRHSRKPSQDRVRVTPHMAQAVFHTARWGRDDLYHQWIFFDDRWAAAHPTLAAGVLTFASRWDVLS
jgi:uncharacterized protein (TIGR02996 family)